MRNIYQKTIANSATFTGIGLHSGLNSKVTILPAKDNHGIIFKRIDLKQNNLEISDIMTEDADLEDVFIQLTKS